MDIFQRIIFAFITFVISIFFIGTSEVNAGHFTGLETKIIAESNTSKIIKLQTFFQKLNLYKGKIDGKHSSVLPSLLAYQKKAKLIKKDSDWGAGYFGIKTLAALKKDFPNKFEEHKYILEQDKPFEGERYFIVTAYYSAIPNQSRYSYSSKLRRYRNYSEAIKMQGKGTNGASGKKVFPGMLAGPRNYQYGTKIELDGIGIGSIEDRGFAIVNAGERKFENDRIDIWMGHGDEGRIRAERWGTRKIKGKIVSTELNTTVKFNESVISKNMNLYITPKSNSIDIKKLQSLFSELKLYNGNINGKYISIKKNLIDFQLKYKIISSKNSNQSGYFGKKAIAILKSKFKIDDTIFKTPIKNINQDFSGLTRKDKFLLVRIRDKIDTYFTKKAKGNKLKIKKQKTALQNKIDKVIKKLKNKNKIKKLKYLKIILYNKNIK